jgi:acetyl esterase
VGGAIIAPITLIAIGILAAFNLTPWPGAQLIRALFRRNDVKVSAALQKHTPDGITSLLDIPYRPGDGDALLDVFLPDAVVNAQGHLPALIWMHGGAWVSGKRQDWHPYFKCLAARGFIVVAIGHSLGPHKRYPIPLHQLDAAMSSIQQNAKQWHIDPERLVLAGDSAGAQITSQYAAVVTNETFAREVELSPALPPDCLKGGLFYCGIYDFDHYFGAPGIIGYGTKVATWAYTGNRDITMDANPALREMSSVNHVTVDFPPTFLSGGNADPLTDLQSKPFAEALARCGVPVTTLFFPNDHEPGLGHEYQFNLDSAEGKQALNESVRFLHSVFGTTEK